MTSSTHLMIFAKILVLNLKLNVLLVGGVLWNICLLFING
jgi:hypothetical protein